MTGAAGQRREEKLPCGCWSEQYARYGLWVSAVSFLCDQEHRQGDRVQTEEPK